MIVDSSALLAILLDEPEGTRLAGAIASAPRATMSAATYVECSVVTDRRTGPAGRERFDRLLTLLGIEVAPLTATQAQIAREAYRRFGRGGGHPAGLDLGDVFSYAVAAETGRPLLFVGDRFAHTDISAVAY